MTDIPTPKDSNRVLQAIEEYLAAGQFSAASNEMGGLEDQSLIQQSLVAFQDKLEPIQEPFSSKEELIAILRRPEILAKFEGYPYPEYIAEALIVVGVFAPYPATFDFKAVRHMIQGLIEDGAINTYGPPREMGSSGLLTADGTVELSMLDAESLCKILFNGFILINALVIADFRNAEDLIAANAGKLDLTSLRVAVSPQGTELLQNLMEEPDWGDN